MLFFVQFSITVWTTIMSNRRLLSYLLMFGVFIFLNCKRHWECHLRPSLQLSSQFLLTSRHNKTKNPPLITNERGVSRAHALLVPTLILDVYKSTRSCGNTQCRRRLQKLFLWGKGEDCTFVLISFTFLKKSGGWGRWWGRSERRRKKEEHKTIIECTAGGLLHRIDKYMYIGSLYLLVSPYNTYCA